MRAQRDPRRAARSPTCSRACCAAPSSLLTGLVIGWRPGNGLLGVIAGLAVAVLFAYAMSWANACVGLSVGDPESAQGIGFILIFPLAFISTCFVPSQTMPGLDAADRGVEPGLVGRGRGA